MVAQGEIWLLEPPNAKRRPVLVISRNEAISVLNNLVVAPITSTIRPIPTNITVGPSEGIDHDSVANFDSLTAVPKALLTVRLGALDSVRHDEICAALRSLSDC